MIGQTIGTPLPGAKNKRVMIAILVSLLFHAGVAGGASVAYWLYKEPSMLDGAAFSLSIQAPDQNELTSPTLSQPAAPVTEPSAHGGEPSASAREPSAHGGEPLTSGEPSTPASESTTLAIQPSAPTREPSPSQSERSDTQVSTIQSLESAPSVPPSAPAPLPSADTQQRLLPELAEPATVRTASVLEHMLVQNLVTNPSQPDSAIRIMPLKQHDTDATDLSDSISPTQQLPVAMQLPRQHVRLETDIDGTPVYSHASIHQKPFSAYAHFIDRWDHDVFLSSDQVMGDFHVNSQIRLADAHNSQPRIHGRLTIGVNQFLTREFQNKDIFLQGVESGVGLIPMDREPLLALMKDIHQGTEIHYFNNPMRLTFQPDGSVRWQSLDDDSQTGLIPSSELPLVMINEGRNRFELSGEVNGHFLIYSPHQIVITGHLRYIDDATNDLTHNSPMLGLVSRRSVEIASRAMTGSGDLRIDAAIYAARRFSVRRFDDDHQGTLHIFGSLAAGSISATEPRFTTLIEKDPRLDQVRPPGFPLTGQTVLAEWEGTWLEQTSQ